MTKVNRRAFLATAGAVTASSIAGCLDGSALTTFERDHRQATPLPGTATIDGIHRVDDGELVVRFTDRRWPRPIKLGLYAEFPTENAPAGDWRVEGASASGRKIPVLTYADEHAVHLSDTIVRPRFGGGRVPLVHGDIPTGVPVQYRVDLIEHTLEGQRRSLGTTGQLLRLPGRERYVIAAINDGGSPRVFNDFTHTNLYHRRHDGDGDFHVSAVGSTNDTRFHAPEGGDFLNRTDEVGRRRYKRGAFERLWMVEYAVTQTEFRRARTHNRLHYNGDPAAEAVEIANIRRMFRDYLPRGTTNTVEADKGAEDTETDERNEQPLARIAGVLGRKAALLGLTRPEQQVRFVADFIQWFPYEHDDHRVAADIPRVQHPLCTLARGTGDCEDMTIALAAILSQDPFPDFEFSVYRFRNQHNPDIRAHFGLAIKDDVWTTDLGGPGSDDYGYTYVEATYPAPLARASPRYHDLELLGGIRSPEHRV